MYFNKIKKILRYMVYKPIIVVAGEPNSIFLKFFLRSLKIQNFKKSNYFDCIKKLN